jgi:hypothetical protein
MIKTMTDYEILDYLLIDYIEAGDLINHAGQDYFVKAIDSNDEGWQLVVVDRYEDELDLLVPDGTVVALLGE